jgi:predicted nucleic acid-binding protein
MLVLDASVVVAECTTAAPLSTYRDELVAPPLLWSEVRSSLHEAAFRGEISRTLAREAHERLSRAPVAERRHRRLGEEAWRIADELGWARTYDAEYVALAALLGCPLVTLDARLRRGAGRLAAIVGPAEL